MLGAYLVALLALSGMHVMIADKGGDFIERAKALGWKPTGPVPQSQSITLTFWLKLTHTHELKEIADKVSDPKSPEYGHYLTKDQIDALTKPTAEHVAAVEKALESQKANMKIASQGATISVNVTVGFAEKLLGGQFMTFCHTGTSDSSSICVDRNPTSNVPQALRNACDIISPIDDGFPPTHPLPGPIISRQHEKGNGFLPVAFAKVQKSASAASTRGCCFSYGFGAFMKPCCLKTHQVDDSSSCNLGQRMGGATKYVNGECPASAEEAAQIKTAAQSSVRPASIDASATSAAVGCCYSIGYGAMMKPCCLTTSSASSAAQCDMAKSSVGGASGFNANACPSTAAEADMWLKSPSGSMVEQRSDTFNLFNYLPQLGLGVAISSGILVGVFFAARRGRDGRSTPFLAAE